MKKEAYTISQYNIVTEETHSRQVTPLPTPQRIQPQPITKAELTGMIADLRQEMADQQTRFDNRDAIDAERTEKKQALQKRVNELRVALSESEAELDELTKIGSVRSEFIEFAKQAEQRIVSIATGAYNFLLEKFSQDRHEASYKELTPSLKEDVRFKADRSGIRSLMQATCARLHRTPADQIFNATIEASLNKVYDATERLEKTLEK